MATYVTSDAHGHLRALDRALELAGPSTSDRIVVMGDMIDRGPDPLGVVRLVRGMDNAHVLMGNHERLMVDALRARRMDSFGNWDMNGGWTTEDQLDLLSDAEVSELVDWAATLPYFDIVSVPDAFSPSRHGDAPAERIYLLVHAGIDPVRAADHFAREGIDLAAPGAAASLDVRALIKMMMAQDTEDLLWIRRQFWSRPTGLVDGQGRGPIVIAGHTPSPLLGRVGTVLSGPALGDDMRARVREAGACRDTGGIADRIDIDCGAAGAAPHGQVCVMRLEDHATWYAPVLEGE